MIEVLGRHLIAQKPLYLLFVQPYISCSPNSKRQIKIKYVKLKDDPKVMAEPKMFGIKKEEVLTYMRLIPKSKGIS